MSDMALWDTLKSKGLLTGDQPEHQQAAEGNLWYVRVLQGFAGWLAALFLMAFLGFGVAGLFEHGEGLIVLGVIINVSTYVFFKSNPDSDFFEQMVLAFSLTGQLLFAVGLLVLADFKNLEWLVVVGMYQAVLAWAVNNYLHRFLCTWFAVIAAFWGFEWLVYSGVGSALVAAGFVWLWLHKTGWESDKDFYEPIAYSLGFVLLTINTQNVLWFHGLFHSHNQQLHWLWQHGPLISALLNSAVLLYFVYSIAKERSVDFSSTSGKLIVLGAVLSLFSAIPVIGLSSALLVLLVGFARQKIILMVMGVLALLGFFSWYYYSLAQTLLFKSIVLIAIGLVLSAAYWLLNRIYHHKEDSPEDFSQIKDKQQVVSNVQKLAAGLTLLLALVGVNHAIMNKENTLETGRSVFLQLAPVDPRSIMQGDYMRLRFDLGNKIRNSETFKNDWQSVEDGLVIVNVDDQGVGTFHAIYQQQPLEANQVLMQFRKRKGLILFATNAFFFQEGDAKLFDNARFGEFKVADDGELLLKAMYDQDLKLLGENRLD